jgi:hypothetical protein
VRPQGARASSRGVVALVTLFAACGGEEAAVPEEIDSSAAVLTAIEANPCDASLTTRGLTELNLVPPDSAIARVLTGTVDLANEAHDCQRLVLSTGASGEFGPLVGLFPVDATLALARADFATARPAVSVYSWGAAGGSYSEEYAPLGLAKGARCLWLRNPTGVPDGWQAALAPGLCGDAPAAPADGDFGLAVFERTYPGATAEDYPRTARWEWDLDGVVQFIGVRCGEAWCAVLPAGSSAPRTAPLPQQLRGSSLVRLTMPGWSDAQHLAVFDSAAGHARPGPWGTILSHPALHGDAPLWTEGILAAAIDVRDDHAAYNHFAELFYLQPENGGGRSDVILRFPGISADEAWYQQGPMRRRQARGVQYAPAVMAPATGVVRWRWREGDPGLWMFCRGGSCAVVG